MAEGAFRITDSDYADVNFSRLLQYTQVGFLMCGGPSLKKTPLITRLNGRGYFTMAVNNAAAFDWIKPNAFVCSDPPKKFQSSIWYDPSIMKFVPMQKLPRHKGVIRQKIKGEFYVDDVSVCHMPNVWGFSRRTWLMPDDSFFKHEASWGVLNRGLKQSPGQPKTACTMLLGLRLLYEMGARTIYLVGADFNMTSEGYAFPQERTEDAVRSNNVQYHIVNDWLCKMSEDGVFHRAGLEVFNCNPDSGLQAFPHRDLEESLQDALTYMPAEPFDTEGWYEKEDSGSIGERKRHRGKGNPLDQS